MTDKQMVVCLENMVLQYGSDLQLLHLQNSATKLQLNDSEYLDYLTCYLKKVLS